MPGRPVFFVQERMGKDGRIFKCHKFRTMRVRPAVAFSGETAAPSTGSGVCSDAGPGTANDDGWSSVLVAGIRGSRRLGRCCGTISLTSCLSFGT